MLLAINTPGTVLISVFSVIIGLFVFYAIAAFVAFRVLFVNPLRANEEKPNKLDGEEFPAFAKKRKEDMVTLGKFPHEDVNVTTRDGLTLRGSLIMNVNPSKITVLCLHGYTSWGKREFAGRGIDLLQKGYNVMLANHRHHGESDGKYVGFATLDRHDALKWIDAVNERIPDGIIFLMGVSMGSATAMQCSCLALPKNVKGIIADCGYTTVQEIFECQSRHLVGIYPKFFMHMVEGYCKIFAGYGFSDSDSREALQHSKVPVLFIHGDNDAFVPLEMSKQNFDACTTEKELVVIEGASHAQAHWKNPEAYDKAVFAFIEKYKDA